MAVPHRPRVARALVCSLVFLGACARHHSVDDCDNPFPQIMGRSATLPSRVPLANGGALVIGTVADSATRHALKGVVLLFYPGVGERDTTLAYTDSAGGFAVRLPGRGRHAYSVGSVGFSTVRGSIDATRSAETLRVAMHHGPWLCNVRVTR